MKVPLEADGRGPFSMILSGVLLGLSTGFKQELFMPAAIECGARSMRWSCSPNSTQAASDRHFEACGVSRETP